MKRWLTAWSHRTTPGAPPAAGEAQQFAGLPHIEQLLATAYSPEATAFDIYYCFRLLLGRNPSPEEWPGHSARVGQPLHEVLPSYLGSLEFARRGLLAPDASAIPERVEVEGSTLHVLANDDAVGRHVLNGSYEPHVTRVFRYYLKPGMAVADIGANIGYFAILAAHGVGPEGAVYAFEPNPLNARLLDLSRRANGYHWLQLHQIALASEPGLLVLNTAFSNGTTSRPDDRLQDFVQAQSVAALTLDTVLHKAPRLDLIKIDVEGAEYDALLGGAQRLARDRPVVLSEFSPPQIRGTSGVEAATYLEFFTRMNYQLGWIRHPGDESAGECDAQGVTWLGQNIDALLAAYEDSGVDHIDFIALPTERAGAAGDISAD